MSNSLFIIEPYRKGAAWVFDAPEHGLRAEPFVLGASEIIDLILESHDVDPEAPFRLIFAAAPFPGPTLRMDRQEKDFGGYWYAVNESSNVPPAHLGRRAWLCPATLKFFPAGHPQSIFARAEASKPTLR